MPKCSFSSIALLFLQVTAVMLVVSDCDGEKRARLGGFCEQDSDCRKGLACLSNVCAHPPLGDCEPPCESELETCFEQECVTILDTSDLDGDGQPAELDCDDRNPQINSEARENTGAPR